MARGKQIGCLAGLALTVASSLFLDFSVGLLFHPWFHGMPGTFSPAGGWSASFEVPGTGRHYAIHLELTHEVDHSPQGGRGLQPFERGVLDWLTNAVAASRGSGHRTPSP